MDQDCKKLTSFFTKVAVARGRHRDLKTEFNQAAILFNDFDFNQKMVEILLTSEHDTPFSNIFQKQIGNLNERYKLVEATYDTLLDKFSEINAIMTRLKKPVEKDKAEAKVARLAARNERLEAENNELKLKLSNKINAVKKPVKQDNLVVIEAKIAALAAGNERLESEINQLKLSKSINVQRMGGRPEFQKNTHVHKPVLTTSLSESHKMPVIEAYKTNDCKDKFKTAPDLLNTVKVGKQLKQLLDTNNIDYYTFANNIIYSSKTVLNQLMSKPKSWADLNIKEKNMYRRMQKWTRATSGEVEELKRTMYTLQKLRSNIRSKTFCLNNNN